MKRKMINIKRNYSEIEKWAKSSETRNITRPEDPLELLKFSICNEFNNYMLRKNIKQKDLAEILGVKASKVSDLANFKLESVSFDRIFGYLIQLASSDKHMNNILESFIKNPLFGLRHLDELSEEYIVKKIDFIDSHDFYEGEFVEFDDELLSA